jgi:hypothetical protein
MVGLIRNTGSSVGEIRPNNRTGRRVRKVIGRSAKPVITGVNDEVQLVPDHSRSDRCYLAAVMMMQSLAGSGLTRHDHFTGRGPFSGLPEYLLSAYPWAMSAASVADELPCRWTGMSGFKDWHTGNQYKTIPEADCGSMFHETVSSSKVRAELGPKKPCL